MHVKLAETAGFCMGVSLALKRLDSLLENAPDGPICTLGPIIHNPQVLEMYARRGVRRIEGPGEAPPCSTVVIRAHGVPVGVERALEAHGVQVVDATCPKVKKAQLLIERQTQHGRTLLLYGEENHPEVQGLLSYASTEALVFGGLEELEGQLEPGRDYVLAAQTTQDQEVFQRIRDYVRAHATHAVPVLDTICDATRVRQEEAIAIARTVDRMVVVGGYESGNTRRLAKVVSQQGVPCVHVETAAELDPADFAGCRTVGLTAGASTHDKTIEEVRALLTAL
ncbi:4-hydroxy-3-methylbut-2-enyl diphosphate reductase [Desulfocurvus sp.]|jgi:4-hydroxy-3-methylbut-2-enyl diphosphate reductase|uniref:4-hydroxy-3-methylbut-2-enyl diphosphate reductase n=1 Tax=Desulfocurvus sp. TaxID=2871698 RepID=UPI0025C4D0EE|nr:4-hydroxy-3-methylbut-2-enyl diphosphate reductase [Desulfocurvus sp.]MCK9240580.1 4-hydroxy-3-methylbut-2-enyl diphosphate reductase [Desulfocurvus sp.]